MSIFTVIETDLEAGMVKVEAFVKADVVPLLEKFFTIFTPLEAKTILTDVINAVPTATTSGVGAAAGVVGAELGQQSLANAEIAAEQTIATAPASAPTTPVTGS